MTTTDIDVSPNQDGAILKKIIRAGPDADAKPWKGDRVTVHYTGTLLDGGQKFDSSVDRKEPFKFNLGKEEVIKGWDVGVATMVKGEIAIFTIRSDYAYGDTGSPPKIPGGATLVFEVELIDFGGEDISKTKDDGIVKRIKTSGEGFDHPNDSGMVTIDLVGNREKAVFDQRNDVTFVLGEGEDSNVPRGLELALEKMKLGEEAQVRLSSKNSFGKNGCGAFGIAPNDPAPLVYDIHLKSFERAKESWQMDGEQKLDQSKLYKEKGTEFFKVNKVDMAVIKYQKVMELLEHEVSLKDEKEEERKELLKAARMNLAMCWLKKGEWIEARNLCDKVIDDNDDLPKAFFRRGEALIHLNDHALAREDFKRCLELDPNNKAASNKIVYCSQQIKKDKDKEKRTFANMFDKFAEVDARKEADRKQREKPVEISEWENGSDKKEGGVIDVHGDVEMQMDLEAEMNNAEEE